VYCCSDAEDSAGVNLVKLLPSAGRGMKVPPICDVVLPKVYYDEKPSHMHMLSISGLGRGQQLQELVGTNGDMEHINKKPFSANTVPKLPVPELPVLSDTSQGDIPVLKSVDGGHGEDAIFQDHQNSDANFLMLKSVNGDDTVCDDFKTSCPNAEVSQISLKSLAAQFTERN